MVYSSVKYLLDHTDQAYIQAISSTPFFEVKMVLQGQELIFQPSIDPKAPDSLSDLFISFIEDIYSLAEQVPLVHGDESYVKQLFEVAKLRDSINSLLDRVEVACQHCKAYRATFMSYDYLWCGDRDDYMKNFLQGEQLESGSRASSSMGESADDSFSNADSSQRSDASGNEDSDAEGESSNDEDDERKVPDVTPNANPKKSKKKRSRRSKILDEDDEDQVAPPPPNQVLDEFERQISRFDTLLKQIISLPTHHVVDGWLRIDSRAFKHRLSNLVQLWREVFTQHLYQIVMSNLDDYSSFISETTVSLTSRPGPPKPGWRF
jgi:hypothetical protein